MVKVRRRVADHLTCEGAELLCAYDETNGLFPRSWSRLMFEPFTRHAIASLLAGSGALLALCGAVMWVLPGPGLPVLLLGLLCLAAAGAVRLIGRPR